MRILLDENLPVKLRHHLLKHQTETVTKRGWGGLKNGELLKAAESALFDVFVTADLNLEYQQNMAQRRIGLVILSTNNWPIIKKHIPKIQAAVDGAGPGSFVRVDCGKFARRNRRGGPVPQ
jgi:predicted nuclease of predicted toxin-antitoxin system